MPINNSDYAHNLDFVPSFLPNLEFEYKERREKSIEEECLFIVVLYVMLNLKRNGIMIII